MMLQSLLKRIGRPSTAAEQRRAEREEVLDGRAIINGVTCPLVNWSPVGFLVRDYQGDHHPGDRTQLAVKVKAHKQEFDFTCSALVVRVDRNSGEFAGIFVNMAEEDRQALHKHFGK